MTERERKIKDEIDQQVLDEINEIVESDEVIRNLRRKLKEAARSRNFVELPKIERKIKERMQYDVDRLHAKYTGYSVSMDKAVSKMNAEDAMDLRACLDSMVLACDVVEGLAVRFDEILQKYRHGERIVSFNNVIRALSEVRKTRMYMCKTAPEEYISAITRHGDNLYEMVFNKGRRMSKELMEMKERAVV